MNTEKRNTKNKFTRSVETRMDMNAKAGAGAANRAEKTGRRKDTKNDFNGRGSGLASLI